LSQTVATVLWGKNSISFKSLSLINIRFPLAIIKIGYITVKKAIQSGSDALASLDLGETKVSLPISSFSFYWLGNR